MNNKTNNEGPKLYKYYFAPTQGRISPQAIEIADLAHKHEILNDSHGTCHIVTFTEDQLDLMASFYSVARNLLPPMGQYFKEGILARLEIQRKLETKGYISANGQKPEEYVPKYVQLKKLIASQDYATAIEQYYESLGNKDYGELHAELIYLKRLGNIHLAGRDLLFFRPESDRSDLVRSNLSEYRHLIAAVISSYKDKGLQLPLDILKETTVAVADVEKPITIVFLNNGKIDKKEVPKIDWLFSQVTRNGRLFDKYIDQVKSCNIFEDKRYNPRYFGFWTTYSPELFKEEITDKGYYLVNIDVYRHKKWRGGKRAPDFTAFTSRDDIMQDTIGASTIEFTGRFHKIEDQIFFEIDLLRDNRKRQIIGNDFLDSVDDILREAENILRENHGLPRIGEGWLSEMTLFRLVESVFPDVQHHISPSWLAPQHLDIFIPSRNIALEYQGKQHYEAVDFFGGEASFEKRKQLDDLKMRKCNSNEVVLIHWRYDEPITKELLEIKLKGYRMSEVDNKRIERDGE
jgi:hypothetical protein